MVIIVFGLPGSGKTYFASRLAAAMQAAYASSDIERKKIFPERNYSPQEKQRVYNRLAQIMKKAIKENRDLVLDATFYKDQTRKRFLDEAGNSPVVFIEVITNIEIAKQRLSRERADSDADWNVYRKIESGWEPLETEHLVLESTNDNIDHMIRAAIAYLNKHQHDKR